MKHTAYQHIYTAACMAAMLVVAACSSDNDDRTDKQDEIRLTAIPATTRAASDIQTAQFVQGEQMAVYITENNDDAAGIGTTYQQPLVFRTTDAVGTLSPKGAATPYFPDNRDHGVDIFALYPSNAPLNGLFTIKTSQDSDEDYMASDLMYGIPVDGDGHRKTVTRADGSTALTFSHQLSKIVVRMEPGSGAPELNGATLRLLGIKPSAQVTASLSGITVGEATGTPSNIVATTNYKYDMSHPEDNTGCAVVIVPQTVPEGPFIRLSMNDETTMNYRLPVGGATFEAGKVYTYNVTVYKGSITVRAEVEGWETADPVSASIKI